MSEATTPNEAGSYHGAVTAPRSPLEVSLRPPVFTEFVGQTRVKEVLLMRLEAALQRGDVLDHVLLSGPPGLGKTTLANIIATTAGTKIHTTSGPQIEKAGDLAGILTNLQKGDLLFIDEIHRLHPAIEEYLYPAMEDYKLDIIIDQGPNARSIQLPLPRFTMIGATTRQGMLTAPLRSRFRINLRFDYYPADDLAAIITRSAGLLGIEIDPPGAQEIARRSRGTPRYANNLLLHARDYAQVRAGGSITRDVADAALGMIDVDGDGLDDMDKRILEAIIHKFAGGPVGVSSVGVAVGEDPGTIEEVNEPFLIMQGYIKRTPRGREALPAAYHKIGAPLPGRRIPEQPELGL